MELKGKVALVTGANGFVGSFIVRRLVEEGLRVRALVRRPEADAEVRALGAEPVRGDPADARSAREAAVGAQVVVHCAATGSDDMAEAMRVNAEGTEAMLEAARAAGCERFVHISTVAVYDMARVDTIDEGAPLVKEGRAYSVSKAEGDRRVLAAIGRGLPAVILRPPCILGVHPTSTWGNKVPRAIVAGQFALPMGGEGHLFYVHVRNLAEAVVQCLRSEAAVGQVFDIADGETTWGRYAAHFRSEPLPAVPESQVPSFLSFRGHFPAEKIRRVLGYTPRYSFEEVMRETQQALGS
ncbi:NAD-dependent epimerase/dehydratase family protein [Archangium lipolyticum]|uniref:NAD-dependent epimerase/dehydratase family protein n=1 Tax=Archangium lipolyticum TaxID=2970465 RepID=UPI002149A822|nr:NAD(P)-dependent oxidoreductase [Archangium lipolyticum]